MIIPQPRECLLIGSFVVIILYIPLYCLPNAALDAARLPALSGSAATK